MTLRNTAVFAFACMLLVTIVQLFYFIRDLSAIVDGIMPPLKIVESLIYLLAAVSATMFLFVFSKSR